MHHATTDNHESQVIDLKLFQSGPWTSEYSQHNKPHGPHYVDLLFDDQKFEVTGAGLDDVGMYTLHGFYSTQTRRMGLTKTYQLGTGNPTQNLGHTVLIQVEWSRTSNQFEGKWYVRTRKFKGSGEFKLRSNRQQLPFLSVYEKV